MGEDAATGLEINEGLYTIHLLEVERADEWRAIGCRVRGRGWGHSRVLGEFEGLQVLNAQLAVALGQDTGQRTLSDRICPHTTSPSAPNTLRSSRNSSTASLLYSLPNGHDTMGSCNGRCMASQKKLHYRSKAGTYLGQRAEEPHCANLVGPVCLLGLVYGSGQS